MKLNRCYFCQSDDLTFSSNGMDENGINNCYVECNGCGAAGPVVEGVPDHPEEAATRAWNGAKIVK